VAGYLFHDTANVRVVFTADPFSGCWVTAVKTADDLLFGKGYHVGYPKLQKSETRTLQVSLYPEIKRRTHEPLFFPEYFRIFLKKERTHEPLIFPEYFRIFLKKERTPEQSVFPGFSKK
jgi:hypothetical protein